MSIQTALALTEVGKPLTKITLPIPDASVLKEHEVLIKVTATGLAPLDQKLRSTNLFKIALPGVLGGDLVGTVVKNGPNSHIPIGEHVFSQVLFSYPQHGGLQEYTIINSLYAAVVPKNISDVEAALYPINAVTAASSFFIAAGFGLPFPGTPEAKSFDYASQKIVIVGGGSNTGKLAIQLARIAGIGTIITVASASNAGLLKSFGATHVISRHDSDITAQVHGIVGDDLIYVYDAVNYDLNLAASFLSESKEGVLVHNVRGTVGDAALLEKKKGGIEVKHIQGFSHSVPEFGQRFWKQLPIWLETGEIKPLGFKVIKGLDAAKINAALDEYAEGKGGKKYIIDLA